jgi:hypothetical protein
MGIRSRITGKAPEPAKEGSPTKIKKIGSSPSVNSCSGLILHLHETIGNQGVQRLIRSGLIQTKPRIGAPNDIYEQEADRVADQVMRMPEKAISCQQTAISKGNESVIQMKPG